MRGTPTAERRSTDAHRAGLSAARVRRVADSSRQARDRAHRALRYGPGPILDSDSRRLRPVLQHFGLQRIANQMAQQSPLARTLRSPAASPLTIATRVLNNPAPYNTFAIDLISSLDTRRSGNSPSSRVWSRLVLTGTYIGTKGTRNPQLFLPIPHRPDTSGRAGACRVHYETSSGNSTYQAGRSIDAPFPQRPWQPVMSTRTPSTMRRESAGAPGRIVLTQNWLDLDAERSDSSFDPTPPADRLHAVSTGQGMHGGALKRLEGRDVQGLDLHRACVASGLPNADGVE